MAATGTARTSQAQAVRTEESGLKAKRRNQMVAGILDRREGK